MGEGAPSAERAGRARVLDAVRARSEPVTVADLAAAVGLHVNTVRFHLERLVADGLVEQAGQERSTGGRPRLTFRAREGGEEDRDQREYQLLAEILAGSLSESVPDAAATSLDAGRAWGRYLANAPKPHRSSTAREGVAELVRVLAEVGFEPRVAGEQASIVELHHCPFREVAEAHREIACSVHLGLMQGLLAAVRAPLTADRLEPFVEPHLCLAHLRDGADRSAEENPTSS
jgi:predicted ArsR family transcriptional regulator